MSHGTIKKLDTSQYLEMGGDPLKHGKELLMAEHVFFHNFGTMLELGVPVMASLQFLLTETRHKKLKKAILSISEAIAAGHALAESMNHPVFSGSTIMMVKLGEITGKLPSALFAVSSCLEKQFKAL